MGVTDTSYEAARARALADPAGYWADAARAVEWFSPPDRVLDDTDPPYYRWFAGATCNTCHNAVDRHVAQGRGAQPAIIHDSAMTGTQTVLSFADLKARVAAVAGGLAELGVGKGDRVLVYMPMIPEAAIAMLACARLGAIHSVVFGGFAPEELAKRVRDARPKVVVCASCGLEPGRLLPYKPMVDAALDLVDDKPTHTVVFQRPEHAADLDRPGDVDWATVEAGPAVDCVPVAATDPLYILYTSGTTGTPKGIVRDNGGHMVALSWSLPHIYGAHAGDVFWAASDVGWVVGHSYIVYAPLLVGCTTVMYEGKPVGTPDAGAFWRVIAQHKVNVLFTAPTAMRAIKRDDPEAAHLAGHDIASLRALFLAGERADPDTVAWCERILDRPVIDNWWQTETGWPISTNYLSDWYMPVKHGSATKPVPGYDVQILDEGGKPVAEPGQTGAIAIKLPLPPGTLPTLWQDDARYREAYLADYPGYYKTGDAGFIDADGYLSIMSRTDDIINVAGHRLSTGAMEEVIAEHPCVAECAVFGVHDSLKGQIPLGMAVLKSGVDRPERELAAELVGSVRDRIGAVAALRTVLIVDRLPKTRSGKILRGTMRKMADGKPYPMPPTIDDPGILEDIDRVLQEAGFGLTRMAE